MKRRTFVALSAGTLVLAILGFLFLDFRKTVRNILLSDLSKLNIGEDAIDQFMAEADKQRFWDQFGLAKRIFIPVQHVLLFLNIRTRYYGKYTQYRNKITGQFLFSTDLFQQPEGQPVSYIGFHNPYYAPCSLPFSAQHVNS